MFNHVCYPAMCTPMLTVATSGNGVGGYVVIVDVIVVVIVAVVVVVVVML